MKKIILVLFLNITIASFSQNERIGIFGGINYSGFSNGFLQEISFGKSLGFHIGGLAELELTDNIAFRPKINLSLQGDRENDDNSSSIPSLSSVNYKLTYLNVPLNFKFFSKPYILIGPQVGFLISSKKDSVNYGDVNNIDFGLNLGIGYDINNFFLEINLFQGMQKLLELKDPTNQISDKNVTNSLIQFGIGYFIK
jgi:hypothetical protein